MSSCLFPGFFFLDCPVFVFLINYLSNLHHVKKSVICVLIKLTYIPEISGLILSLHSSSNWIQLGFPVLFSFSCYFLCSCFSCNLEGSSLRINVSVCRKKKKLVIMLLFSPSAPVPHWILKPNFLGSTMCMFCSRIFLRDPMLTLLAVIVNSYSIFYIWSLGAESVLGLISD